MRWLLPMLCAAMGLMARSATAGERRILLPLGPVVQTATLPIRLLTAPRLPTCANGSCSFPSAAASSPCPCLATHGHCPCSGTATNAWRPVNALAETAARIEPAPNAVVVGDVGSRWIYADSAQKKRSRGTYVAGRTCHNGRCR